MNHNAWRLGTLLAIALVGLAFAVSRYTAPLQAGIPSLTGTYWNLNAGFGDSELIILADGRYTDGGIGAVSVEGTYTLRQDQIVFSEYGPADAPCLHIPGTYKWALTRQTLALKQVQDACPTRAYDWGSGLWIKQAPDAPKSRN